MSNYKPQAGAPASPQRPPPQEGGESVNGSGGLGGRSAEETQQLPKVEQQVATPPAASPHAGGQRPPDSPPASAPAKPQQAAQKSKSADRARKARLRMVRVDPWSVMKLAFALSIALAIVTVVAVTIVWAVLGAAGVWDAINSSVATVLSDNASEFDITDYVGFGRIIGLTLIISAVDIVLITALATVGAFMYNLAASLLGGLEVTLAEDR